MISSMEGVVRFLASSEIKPDVGYLQRKGNNDIYYIVYTVANTVIETFGPFYHKDETDVFLRYLRDVMRKLSATS